MATFNEMHDRHSISFRAFPKECYEMTWRSNIDRRDIFATFNAISNEQDVTARKTKAAAVAPSRGDTSFLCSND